MDKQAVICQLYDIGAVRVGEFTLASGLTSNIYIDLRQIISYPELLKAVSELIWASLSGVKADLMCGVPYTALPIATAIALENNIPMVMVRKEPKKYGTKKQVEGVFKPGQSCYMIEDLVTTGGSVIKAANILEAEGLKVNDVAVLIDRQQGGKANCQTNQYHLHAVMTITEVIDVLREAGKLSDEENGLVDKHLQTLTT